jgi:hypothetical protein
MRNKNKPHNLTLAIVGLQTENTIFVILLGICVNVGLPFFKCFTLVNAYTGWLNNLQQLLIETK